MDPFTGVSFRAEFRELVFVLFGIAWRAPWIGAASAMREEGSPVRCYGFVDHLQPFHRAHAFGCIGRCPIRSRATRGCMGWVWMVMNFHL